jgi:hypothetical protein
MPVQHLLLLSAESRKQENRRVNPTTIAVVCHPRAGPFRGTRTSQVSAWSNERDTQRRLQHMTSSPTGIGGWSPMAAWHPQRCPFRDGSSWGISPRPTPSCERGRREEIEPLLVCPPARCIAPLSRPRTAPYEETDHPPGGNLVKGFADDLQFLVRSLRKTPGFTVPVILALRWRSASAPRCSVWSRPRFYTYPASTTRSACRSSGTASSRAPSRAIC